MGVVSKIKLKVGLSKLNKRSVGVVRSKRVHNFESARRVGVLSYASTDHELQQAVELVSFLSQRNLEVCLMVYIPEKEIPQDYLEHNNANTFCRKDLNWYGKPRLPFVDEFINMDFNILIDLSMHEEFPLRWIATLSKAQFKVGGLSYLNAPYDMTISLTESNDLEYYISQMKHYLNLINNRFAQVD